MRLYETHLPVADTEASRRFYVEKLGLTFGLRDANRDIVFLFIGPDKQSMLGLWGPTSVYGRHPRPCHLAIEVPLPELLTIGRRLNEMGITTENFTGEKTTDPSVIGWMPSAQIYFTDPDGHSLEFISRLDDPPRPDFLGPYSTWQSLKH